jgi:hypothetical protein
MQENEERIRLYEALKSFRFQDRSVPEHDHGSLVRYILDGVIPGGFLQAVLSNDLREACARADDQNLFAIPVIVAWLYNYAPANCWGSKLHMETHAGAIERSRMFK